MPRSALRLAALACAGLLAAGTVGTGHRVGTSARTAIPRAAASVFPVFDVATTHPFACTAWYLGDGPQSGQTRWSYYVAAGHCPIPQAVRSPGWHNTVIVGFARDPSTDTAIGLRADTRTDRAHLVLDPDLPPPHSRAVLIARWPDSSWRTPVLTYLGEVRGRLRYASPIPIMKGWSGAPIVSPGTERVEGMLVGIARVNCTDDPYTVEAIPSPRILLLASVSAPLLALPRIRADAASGPASSFLAGEPACR